jgi:hypothetical protein
MLLFFFFGLGTGRSFSAEERSDSEGAHLTIAEVDAWSCAFDLPKGFMILCLMKHRNSFTFV